MLTLRSSIRRSKPRQKAELRRSKLTIDILEL